MNREELIKLFIEKLKIAETEARKKASAIFELNDALTNSEVTFSYIKSDGTTRVARGTMRAERLPEFKGTGRPINRDLQIYFDLDKNSFRCFKKANFVEIIKKTI